MKKTVRFRWTVKQQDKSKQQLRKIVVSFAMLNILIIFFSQYWSFLLNSSNKIWTKEQEKVWTHIQIEKKAPCSIVATEETYVTRYGVRSDLATKAYRMSGGDMDFIKTVEVESKWDINAVGDSGSSKGLCQWHIAWHKETRNDPNFKDADWQLKKCFEAYNSYMAAGNIRSRLYWYRVRAMKNDVFDVKTYQNTFYICK